MAGGPLLLACSFVLYNLMYFALVSFLPALLMERMNIAIGTAGILSAVVVGANILGNLVAGILIGRGAKRSTLIAVSSAVMGAMGLGIFMSALPVQIGRASCRERV